MAWGHSVATVVIDATDQQGIGFGPRERVIVALLVELGLHSVKEITIEDGGLLAGEDLALEGDLADVEPIAQKMGERATGEWDAANRAPGLERSHLGDDPPLAKVNRSCPVRVKGGGGGSHPWLSWSALRYLRLTYAGRYIARRKDEIWPGMSIDYWARR